MKEGLPQPSEEWIEYYISEYDKNNVITDVIVEYVNPYVKGVYINKCALCGEITYNNGKLNFVCPNHEFVKVNSSNEISITKVKDSWSKEEVKALFITKFESMMPKLKEVDDFKGDTILDAIAWAEDKAEQRERKVYLRAISELDKFII